jgi:hypothetical protein
MMPRALMTTPEAKIKVAIRAVAACQHIMPRYQFAATAPRPSGIPPVRDEELR